MAIYSIKDLEALSDIKAHTLRIWEQRYGIIQPQRSATNIRFYTDEDLRKVLNISFLNKNGVKISKIAKMTDTEIKNAIDTLANKKPQEELRIDALTIATIEMNEISFQRAIGEYIEVGGLEKTMIDIIFPFLHKIGLLWMTGSVKPVQERFITNLIRQKILTAIDNIELNPSGAAKFMIFLPEEEQQELSLLFLHFIIKTRGFDVLNIGSNNNMQDLATAVDIYKPDYLFTLFNQPSKISLERKIADIAAEFSNNIVVVSGAQAATYHRAVPKNIVILKNLTETLGFLKHIKPNPPTSSSL